jgi:hypothetical protein
MVMLACDTLHPNPHWSTSQKRHWNTHLDVRAAGHLVLLPPIILIQSIYTHVIVGTRFSVVSSLLDTRTLDNGSRSSTSILYENSADIADS